MSITEKNLINEKVFLELLKEKINVAMIAAAKPILDEALKDIEKEMQKTLGGMVVGFMDSYMSIERMGADLRIIVKHDHSTDPTHGKS